MGVLTLVPTTTNSFNSVNMSNNSMNNTSTRTRSNTSNSMSHNSILPEQIKLIIDNSIRENNAVMENKMQQLFNEKFNEINQMLITSETIDFYFKRAEELFQKSIKMNNHINIYKTHFKEDSVPSV